jgi:hypothetical protein
MAPGWLREDGLSRNALLIARGEDGAARLCGIGNRPGTLRLEGHWSDYGVMVQEVLKPERNPHGHRRYVTQRIRQMVEAGFAIEAVALLNTYIELCLRESSVVGFRDAVLVATRCGG